MELAIFETGGKQYVVREGDVITVEKLSGVKDGKVVFKSVLLVDDGNDTKIGAPHISGASISAEVVSEGRHKKVTVIRYRQKSRYFKKRGHRQPYTKVKIEKIG